MYLLTCKPIVNCSAKQMNFAHTLGLGQVFFGGRGGGKSFQVVLKSYFTSLSKSSPGNTCLSS